MGQHWDTCPGCQEASQRHQDLPGKLPKWGWGANCCLVKTNVLCQCPSILARSPPALPARGSLHTQLCQCPSVLARSPPAIPALGASKQK